mmetsp:Transcript_11489/g.37758  ORF Transcript_11489/g.37758 Transcript_11489/m.37758 type:complete len:243 (-) Transcript_11489:406-1134(-)
MRSGPVGGVSFLSFLCSSLLLSRREERRKRGASRPGLGADLSTRASWEVSRDRVAAGRMRLPGLDASRHFFVCFFPREGGREKRKERKRREEGASQGLPCLELLEFGGLLFVQLLQDGEALGDPGLGVVLELGIGIDHLRQSRLLGGDLRKLVLPLGGVVGLLGGAALGREGVAEARPGGFLHVGFHVLRFLELVAHGVAGLLLVGRPADAGVLVEVADRRPAAGPGVERRSVRARPDLLFA